MMLTCLALLGALTRGQAADLEFARVQEETVYSFCRPHRFDSILEARQARLVRGLGCGHGDCRDTAEEALRAMGPAALRALWWGSKAKDPEVALRCRRMTLDLFVCGCPRDDYCDRCRGTRDVRYVERWSRELGDDDWFPANLFQNPNQDQEPN